MKTGYGEKRVEDLRDELRERALKVSGSKQELVARLEEDDTETNARLAEAQAAKAGYRERTVEDLRDELRERDLKVSGRRRSWWLDWRRTTRRRTRDSPRPRPRRAGTVT